MFRLKISQIKNRDQKGNPIRSEPGAFSDVLDGWDDPAPDHYSDSVFVTPRLPVKKQYLDKMQKFVALGFDMSTPDKAMQVMSFNSDAGPLFDQVSDMTPQEYQMLFAYVSQQEPGAFVPATHREMTEDVALGDGPMLQTDMSGQVPNYTYAGPGSGDPINTDTGKPMELHVEESLGSKPPAPYKGKPELVDPNLLATIKTLVNLKKPYSTKQEALASIRQLYNRVPEEQLAQQPGYKELMGMDDHLYGAYALPKALEAMGIHQASFAVRLPMQRLVIAASDPQDLSVFISFLIESGFDSMHDYDSAMQVVRLMPNNPIAAELAAIPRGSWSALVGMGQRIAPEEAPQTPIQYEAPIVPKELTIKPDQVKPYEPGTIRTREDIKTQEIPSAKAYQPAFKDKGKTQLLSMYQGFTDYVAKDTTYSSKVTPLRYGQSSPYKINGVDKGSRIPLAGGMFVIRWGGPGEDYDSLVPGTKNARQEGMVIGVQEETDLAQVVLYPYNTEADITLWPIGTLQQSRHRTVMASVNMSFVSRHAQMPPAQTTQSPTGQQIQPGDFIESPQGTSGQVSQIAPDGKLIIQDQAGQKVMKDPNEQFEVIKPEGTDTATPPAPGQPPSAAGGPNMLK